MYKSIFYPYKWIQNAFQHYPCLPIERKWKGVLQLMTFVHCFPLCEHFFTIMVHSVIIKQSDIFVWNNMLLWKPVFLSGQFNLIKYLNGSFSRQCMLYLESAPVILGRNVWKPAGIWSNNRHSPSGSQIIHGLSC